MTALKHRFGWWLAARFPGRWIHLGSDSYKVNVDEEGDGQ